MAVFKVGQRVRIVKYHETGVGYPHPLFGKEGVVTYAAEYGTYPYSVEVKGHPWGPCPFTAGELSPILDPRADQFIESIKKLAYVEPVAPVRVKQ